MIRRNAIPFRHQLLIVGATIVCVVASACSDVTGANSVAGKSPEAIFAANSGGTRAVTVLATINGGGTANMDDGMGSTAWGGNIKLLSDGSADGEFHCVDQHGSAPGYPGNISGKATSWSTGTDGLITVSFIGKLVVFPGGHPQDIPFQVTIQRFGGAGVGHWTLAVPNGAGGWVTVCFETLTSGQIVIRGELPPAAAIVTEQSGSVTLTVSGVGPSASAEVSRPCTAPGGGYPGALNMLHDRKMFDVPMLKDAPQGNAGMFHAVDVSSC